MKVVIPIKKQVQTKNIRKDGNNNYKFSRL